MQDVVDESAAGRNMIVARYQHRNAGRAHLPSVGIGTSRRNCSPGRRWCCNLSDKLGGRWGESLWTSSFQHVAVRTHLLSELADYLMRKIAQFRQVKAIDCVLDVQDERML